jgi:hypothetical protein
MALARRVRRPTRRTVSRSERKLPRPPTFGVRREFSAIIEPALRDIPDSPDVEIEGGAEVVQSERHDLFGDDELLRARDAALGDERVQRLLVDQRYSVIGASRRFDDKERREPSTVVVVYRYGDQRTVEVWLEGDREELRVSDVVEADYQPAPSDEEIAYAIELARGGRGVAEHLVDDYEATALLTSDVEPGDLHYGSRRFVVGFGPADERQPRVRVLVDVGAERVLTVETTHREREYEPGEDQE